jgi:hypothetical protein
MPGAQQTAEQHQLAKVIRVVIGCSQSLPQNSLPLTVRNFCKEVCIVIADQLDEALAVIANRLRAFIPGFVVGGCGLAGQ